jgi:uncharacterized OB-fold protein
MTAGEDMLEAAFPAPATGGIAAPYWRALEQGRLVFQRCGRCGNAWLPARTECPRCLAPEPHWEDASGRAKLVSWVVYHHGYHEYYAARLPYNVAVVELEEGPRLISNIVADVAALRIDMPLRLEVRREAGVALARFAPA